MKKKKLSVFMSFLLAGLSASLTAAAAETGDGGGTAEEAPAVYMNTDISAEGLMAVYGALEASPTLDRVFSEAFHG